MERINSELLKRFVMLRDRYHELLGQVFRKEIMFEDLLAEINMDNIHAFRNECARDYANNLLKEKDYPDVYRKDIITAIQEEDLDKLEILDAAPLYAEGLADSETDIRMLWFYVTCFNKDDKKRSGLAKVLFERLLDTSEWDLPAYTDILDAIISVQRPEGWYESFVDALKKLIIKTDESDRTYDVLRKGLSNDSRIVRSTAEMYLPSPEEDDDEDDDE